MITTSNIRITKTANSRLSQVDFNKLDFGKYMSDHMLVAHYKNGSWEEPEIVPYADITIAPTALALHYGQSVFEGMKAFRMNDGNISIFRIDKHHDRLQKSLARMSMPELPHSIFSEGLKSLIALDHKWVPGGENTSMYIRPLVFASEAKFGVKISEEYLFIIMMGPVDYFYNKPLNVKVEDKFIRAAEGGTGAAKCAGNYGGAFYPTSKAKQEGFDQVLWTDGSKDLFIEESGTMNVMFVIDGKIVTPALTDSILQGVTRDSILTLAKSMNIVVEERSISAEELLKAHQQGLLTEAFGTGTAAITAPIKMIGIREHRLQLPDYTNDSLVYKLREELTNIRLGISRDRFNWNSIIRS